MTYENISRAYKYYIVSYKIKGGKKFYQSKSPVIHVAMSQEKSTNVKSITVNKTNKKVAEVTRKGKIRAKKKGSCSIFVIANNGVSKEIKVTVK